MKKFLFILFLLFSSFTNVFSDNSPLAIMDETFIYRKGHIYYIAKVQNNSDKAIFVTGGYLKLFNEWDTFVEQIIIDSFSTVYLEPGDYTYISTRNSRNPWTAYEFGEDGPSRFEVVIDDNRYKYISTNDHYSHIDNVKMNFGGWKKGTVSRLELEINNESEDLLFLDSILFALYDEDSHLIDVKECGIGYYGAELYLHPGSTFTANFILQSDFYDSIDDEITIPASADAILFTNGDEIRNY